MVIYVMSLGGSDYESVPPPDFIEYEAVGLDAPQLHTQEVNHNGFHHKEEPL
jgi:hypothetical protein